MACFAFRCTWQSLCWEVLELDFLQLIRLLQSSGHLAMGLCGKQDSCASVLIFGGFRHGLILSKQTCALTFPVQSAILPFLPAAGLCKGNVQYTISIALWCLDFLEALDLDLLDSLH